MVKKETYRFWVNKEGKPLTGKYYDFNTFKVYWAYRWFIAKGVDYYQSITPIKTQTGYKIEETNYAETYT